MRRNLKTRLLCRLYQMRTRFNNDRRGSIAAMTAICSPFLVAGLALSVDASYWRYRQTVLQSSADTSAVSVIYEITSIANHANGGTIVDNNTTFPITYTVGGSSKTFLNIGAYSTFLTATAQFDSKRNCTETGGFACSAAMTWPVGTDYTSAYVVTVDNTARRFFSPMITTSAKTMGSHAVATTSGTQTIVTTGTTGGSPDDGCVMSLTGQVYLANSSYLTSPCTVIANGGNIDAESNAYIAGTVYATGSLIANNMQGTNAHGGVAFGGQQKPNMAAISDPYSSASNYPSQLRSGSASASTLFPVTAASASSIPCNDVDNGGNMQSNSLTSQNTANQDWNAANNANPYLGAFNLSQGGVVNQQHPFKGFTQQPNGSYSITGGGRWCEGLTINNATINFGPGTYIIEHSMNLSGATINGDGATIVVNGPQNSNISGSTVFNMRAPVQGTVAPVFGPTGTGDLSRGISGIVFTTGPVNTGSLAINGNTFNIEGDIYLPTNPWTSQSGLIFNASLFSGTPGNGVSAATITASGSAGCGRLIAQTVSDTSTGSFAFGNTCQLSYGVQPFGTSYATTGSGSGWSGAPTPATTKRKTTASTYPRITQ